MMQISVDNAVHFIDPEDAMEEMDFDTMAEYMDDETSGAVHRELVPCTYLERPFCCLELAPDDPTIGIHLEKNTASAFPRRLPICI